MNQFNTNKKLQKEPENNKSESKAYSPKRQTPGKTGGAGQRQTIQTIGEPRTQ